MVDDYLGKLLAPILSILVATDNSTRRDFAKIDDEFLRTFHGE
jgi:hypothetical protein